MSTKAQMLEEHATDAAEAPALPVKTTPLQRILKMIRRDSQTEPQAYLEESKVPHGGE